VEAIHGEVVVLGNAGRADYQALEKELGNPNSDRLMFYASNFSISTGGISRFSARFLARRS
jgi:hypothetical protein